MGGIEELVEQAQAIGVDPEQQHDPRTSPRTEPHDPARPTAGAAGPEPKVGSYEAFMASFGSPARWAGR